jgi:hypothetical protein
MRPRHIELILASAVLLWGVLPAMADPPPPPPWTLSLQPIAWWAVPSSNPGYIGYYVGGGCSRCLTAGPRYPDEGTWGWDFRGRLIPRHVDLGWWHGRRYQGGTGAYKTDGPQYHGEPPHE